MKIVIDREAAKWYKDEFEMNDEAYLRFYVRYGGMGGNIPGFSLAIKESKPENPYVTTKVDNIVFFVEETDVWYFDGKDLKVDFNQSKHEPILIYE